MSRIRSMFFGRLRAAGLASLVCAAALLVAGCASLTHEGGKPILTFWERPSKYIHFEWAGTCNRGDIEQQSHCAFYVIRARFCNELDGAAGLYCYAATEPHEWLSFRAAAIAYGHRGYGCIAAKHDSGIYWDWQWRSPSARGCEY